MLSLAILVLIAVSLHRRRQPAEIKSIPQEVPASVDRTVYIRVGCRVFTAPASILAHRSEIFSNMLSVPQPPGPIEGHSLAKPIELSGVTAEEFKWLMLFLLGENYEHQTSYTVEGLLAILRLADLYHIPDAHRFAIAQLEHLPTLADAIRLHIAIRYNVPQWFKGAARKILSKPLHMIPPKEMSFLSAELLRRIAQHRHNIESVRLAILTLDCTYRRGLSCTERFCAEAWHMLTERYKTVLVHGTPDGSVSLGDIRLMIVERPRRDLCADCHDASSLSLWMDPMWAQEGRRLTEAVDDLFRRFILRVDSEDDESDRLDSDVDDV